MSATKWKTVIDLGSTKWKIQTAIAYGWADIKCSSDGGESYVDDHYDTVEEALSEMRLLGSNDPDSWRVVPASTPQDDDLYD